MMQQAEHFGVAIDRLTGKVRRIFNPDFEWEFVGHRVDKEVEEFVLERKEDWGVPLEPNGMTLDMVAYIKETFEARRN